MTPSQTALLLAKADILSQPSEAQIYEEGDMRFIAELAAEIRSLLAQVEAQQQVQIQSFNVHSATMQRATAAEQKLAQVEQEIAEWKKLASAQYNNLDILNRQRSIAALEWAVKSAIETAAEQAQAEKGGVNQASARSPTANAPSATQQEQISPLQFSGKDAL